MAEQLTGTKPPLRGLTVSTFRETQSARASSARTSDRPMSDALVMTAILIPRGDLNVRLVPVPDAQDYTHGSWVHGFSNKKAVSHSWGRPHWFCGSIDYPVPGARLLGCGG
ncbi:hypothetical protein ANRL4_05574 [Anaerolineae bacterium]|nr:hypothetical protein ANRL4_05574 [Anaerolineae bacterium]